MAAGVPAAGTLGVGVAFVAAAFFLAVSSAFLAALAASLAAFLAA